MTHYFLVIEHSDGDYQGRLHQGDGVNAHALPALKLGPDAVVKIRDKSYPLGTLVQKLTDFDERAQLELGQHLYTEVFATCDPKPLGEGDVQLRIITEDEHLLRLPWPLLVRNDVFLMTTGWSVMLDRPGEPIDCELPPSPRMLVALPQPDGVAATAADAHLEELEKLLSSTDHRFYRGKHLHVVHTWEDLQTQVKSRHFDVLYYYGHGIADGGQSRLVFQDKARRRHDVPVADLANRLRQSPDGPPLLIYVNCCHGDAGGLLGAGRQLLNAGKAAAVITNRTVAYIDAARRQALEFWRATLLEGAPPHAALSNLYSRLGDLDLSLANTRWMTPVLHGCYRNWRANPPQRPNQVYRDPYWPVKVDRKKQFPLIAYETREMLDKGKPRSLVYIWYGQQGQGIDLFHKRLSVELRQQLSGIEFVEVCPKWPDDLYNANRSFEDMMREAFEISALDDVIGRIRSKTRGETNRRILVYVRHEPVVLPGGLMNAKALRSYIEWWDCRLVRILAETDYFALLGVSFEVDNPITFLKTLEKRVENLKLNSTVLHILDEMERLAIKDLRDFVNTHEIELPNDREEQILAEILKLTGGHYEKTLAELARLFDRAFDMTGKGGTVAESGDDNGY